MVENRVCYFNLLKKIGDNVNHETNIKRKTFEILFYDPLVGTYQKCGSIKLKIYIKFCRLF